ncbi:MAG: GUN4 domain-containing protein, partial [Phormidesmis sp.]
MSSNATKFTEPAADLSQPISQPSISQPSLDTQANYQASEDNLAALAAALSAGDLKRQLQALREVKALEAGASAEQEAVLASFVRDRMSSQNPDEPTAAHGSAYQLLYRGASEAAKSLIEAFPHGLVCPQSDRGVDYSDLQMLLVKQAYQAADKLTNQKLCELAGESAMERKWVYFTEVSQFPVIDLQAMDVIWSLYSEGK